MAVDPLSFSQTQQFYESRQKTRLRFRMKTWRNLEVWHPGGCHRNGCTKGITKKVGWGNNNPNKKGKKNYEHYDSR